MIIFSLIILLFSAILHEIAHGYVAEKLGDPTARLAGRITLDPRKHIDPVLSVAIPLLLLITGSPVLFGGAKPVPVDPYNLKEGRKDIALVSLAGPLTNILIAIIAALIYKLFPFGIANTQIGNILPFLTEIVRINLLLAIFNLIPIPPLDGSKVFSLLLPEELANRYLAIGSIGMFIILFLLVFPIGGFSLQDLISRIYYFTLSILGL